MKTKSPVRVVALLSLAVSLAVVAGMTGCVAVAAGAGAGAAVAWVRGELQTNLSADFENAVRATNRALTQLQLAKISEKKDALNAVITARNAADKKIEIQLANAARNLTKVEIRVGVFGDEPLSIAILEKIKDNL
ncbi:DUF3568 family protein [Opitutus terrae]|uniref:DUF3568 family protein n=1 Tax=Opitutus terrae (strain DSM 11246 / JCM 15787 / PB90-1) TaxID=452637 RepID=B1ZTT3_OPITP|nr:DUF3568 family protein [Opitutus terrae]ACB74869.1 conserved hypothetical protein [Opitutus terrae PB90-1]